MTETRQGQAVALVSEWYEYPGGPAADVTNLTITVTPLAGPPVVLGPTAVGITHPATGVYGYEWTPDADADLGVYVVTWNADGGLSASETVEVLASYGTLYATLAELKAILGGIDDTYDDDNLTRALGAASRGIDKWCKRRFYRDDTATARVFSPISAKVAIVDDFWTTDDLVIATGDGDDTYATTWTAADRQLEPLNGIVNGVPGWPYWLIRARNGSSYTGGSVGGVTLQVTAKWGWAAVPVDVNQACLLLAEEIFKLKDAPFGVAGYGIDGAVMRVQNNPKIAAMLAEFRRDRVLVA
jgi:hypothetical protein